MADMKPRLFKTCNECHVTLPRERFHDHPKAAYGLSPTCKDCVRERGQVERLYWKDGAQIGPGILAWRAAGDNGEYMLVNY